MKISLQLLLEQMGLEPEVWEASRELTNRYREIRLPVAGQVPAGERCMCVKGRRRTVCCSVRERG